MENAEAGAAVMGWEAASAAAAASAVKEVAAAAAEARRSESKQTCASLGARRSGPPCRRSFRTSLRPGTANLCGSRQLLGWHMCSPIPRP